MTDRSPDTPWYDGPILLELLESLPPRKPLADAPARLAVQTVLRPARAPAAAVRSGTSQGSGSGPVIGPATGSTPDLEPRSPGRMYAGPLLSGRLEVGQEVVILPSGVTTRIAALESPDGPRTHVSAPANVVFWFSDDVDSARGDLVVPKGALPTLARTLTLTVSWMHEEPLVAGRKLIVKTPARKTRAIVKSVHHRVDLSTLNADHTAHALSLNDIGRVEVTTLESVALDLFADNPANGRLILIDPVTKETVGAGLVEIALAA